MAEMNNFEDIQNNVEYITKVLDSMRLQNTVNAENTEKVLANINNQLDSLSNEENADLIKIFLAELKRSLEERHNFVASKFSEIETSFNDLSEKTQSQLQASEIKELFEIIATNLGAFAQNFSSQKELISELSIKLEEFHQDDSQKRDILKNIAVLKVDLEKLSNGFESVIINLNDKFREISEKLLALDSEETLVSIKKEIENIFLSSNAVLSTLQVIDKKNRELEEVITQVVTKDDFNLEREQVAQLITQNIQISDYISKLPVKDNLEDLTEKVDTAVGVINALKNMLSETGKQNQELLSAQLDNLEAKILNISTEEEFIGFRKELADFSKEIIQSTNLMRADISDTNSELKDLLSFLSSMDIKNTFETFENKTKEVENNIVKTISDVSGDLTKEIGKNKDLTKSDILKSNETLSEKLDAVKQEITESSRLNLSSILENIQSVINNVFSIKNTIQLENAETVEVIDSKIQNLKENISESNLQLLSNSKTNVENILENVEKVYQELNLIKGGLGENAEANAQTINSGLSKISEKISQIKEDLSESTQETLSGIVSIIEDFSKEITNLKSVLESLNEESTGELKSQILDLSEKLPALQNTLYKVSEINSAEIKSAIEDLTNITQNLKMNLEQSSSIAFAGFKSNLQEMAENLQAMEEHFEIKSQSNLAKIVALFEELTLEFTSYKEFLSEASQSHFEGISSYIQNLTQFMDRTKEELKEDITTGISDLASSIEILPETIKANIIASDNEQKFLIEENSRLIEEIGEKIQTLVKGLIAKDTPFKNEILFEFDQLKTNLEALKQTFSESGQAFNESISAKITENIEQIETSIDLNNEKYQLSLTNLQNKLAEYHDALENTNEEANIKLSNTLKETGEIKTEIISLLQALQPLAKEEDIKEVSLNLQEKFEDVLIDISRLESVIETKTKEPVQEILSSVEQNFEKISLELKGYKNASNAQVEEFVEDLGEKIENIKTQINLSGTDLVEILNTRINKIVENFEPIQQAIEKISEFNFENMILDVQNKIDSFSFNITTAFKENIKLSNSEQIEQISSEFNLLSDKLNEISAKISEFNSLDVEETRASFATISKNIEDTQSTLSEKIANQGFAQKIEELASKISDLLDNKFDESEINLRKKLDLLEDKVMQNQEEIRIEISSDISQAQEDIKTTLLSELQENLNVVKETFSSLMESNSISDEISSKMEQIQDTFAAALEELDSKLLASEEKYKTSSQSLISGIKTSFQEKVEDTLDDLKSFIEVLEDRNDMSKNIENFRLDVLDKFAEQTADINASISDISVKKELQELQNEIQSSLDALLTMIEESFNNSIEKSEAIIEISNKSEEISQRIDEFKNNISEEIKQKFDGLEEKIETSKNDFSDMIEDLKTSINELKENYIDLSVNSTMEMSGLLADIQEKIQTVQNNLDNIDLKNIVSEISEKIDTINFDSSFDSVESKLSQEFESINQKLDLLTENSNEELDENISEIKNLIQNQSELLNNLDKIVENSEFDVIHQKLDLIAQNSNEELDENISEIKNLIQNQSELLNNLDKLPENNQLTDLKKEIQGSLEDFESKLNALSLDSSDAGTDSSWIKSELSNLKDDLFANIIEIFNQISFVEEAEDIKDFVEEKAEEIKAEIKEKIKKLSNITTESGVSIDTQDLTEEIKASLKDSLDNNFNEILSSLDSLCEKTSDFGSSYSDIKSELKEVKHHLLSTKGVVEDDEEYSYTLQDIESDIAKVRLILKELSDSKQTTGSEDLEKLNEDILSLSSRTNKLLLNSDESYNVLRDNLSEFRNIIYQLEEKVSYIDNSEMLNSVDKKIDNINTLMHSSLKSDKIFNQTFMYLAQWVDDASESLENITEKVTEIDGIKLNISELKKAVPKTANLETILDEISEKFDKQQAKIEALEEKIASISVSSSGKMNKTDIKNIVAEVISQMEVAEIKSDTKVNKKIENIDKQLVKLNKSIEKLTSYVD